MFFTTLSTTAVLEKIRDQIKAAVPAPASFITNGVRTVFPLSSIESIQVQQQTTVSPPNFISATIDPELLRYIPGSVGTIAFGSFLSPDYETPQKYIPAVGTLNDPVVQGINTLTFDLILPSGPAPTNRWPVAIFGHGGQRSKEDAFTQGSIMAEHGFATIAINSSVMVSVLSAR